MDPEWLKSFGAPVSSVYAPAPLPPSIQRSVRNQVKNGTSATITAMKHITKDGKEITLINLPILTLPNVTNGSLPSILATSHLSHTTAVAAVPTAVGAIKPLPPLPPFPVNGITIGGTTHKPFILPALPQIPKFRLPPLPKFAANLAPPPTKVKKESDTVSSINGTVATQRVTAPLINVSPIKKEKSSDDNVNGATSLPPLESSDDTATTTQTQTHTKGDDDNDDSDRDSDGDCDCESDQSQSDSNNESKVKTEKMDIDCDTTTTTVKSSPSRRKSSHIGSDSGSATRSPKKRRPKRVTTASVNAGNSGLQKSAHYQKLTDEYNRWIASKPTIIESSFQPRTNATTPWKCPHVSCEDKKGNRRWHTNRKKLLDHYRRHTQFAFKCTVCEAAFSRLSNLRDHSLKHSGIKPFRCDYPGCGASFQQSHSLKDHKLKHLNIRKWKCDVCDKTYTAKHNLQKHMRDKHSVGIAGPSFDCSVCGKSYRSKHGMTAHIRNKHNTKTEK